MGWDSKTIEELEEILRVLQSYRYNSVTNHVLQAQIKKAKALLIIKSL